MDSLHSLPSEIRLFFHNHAVATAATCAATSSVVLGYPPDLIKTRMQLSKYSSTFACITETYKNDGFRGFFRGMLPVLLSVSFLRSISFTNFTTFKSEILDRCSKNNLHPLSNIIIASSISGTITGTIIALLNAPFEFVKILRQSSSSSSTATSKSSLDWTKSIIKKRGLKGLYFGSHLHVLRDGLGTCLYFTGYETMKFGLSSFKVNPGLSSLISGGITGTACWLVLFPIDLVKTVIQRDSLSSRPRHTSTISFIKETLRKGGIKRFYRGITPTLVRSFPVHSMNFFVYEKVLAII